MQLRPKASPPRPGRPASTPSLAPDGSILRIAGAPTGVPQWRVRCVVDCRETAGGREFLVEWLDFPTSENSWEPRDNLLAAQDALAQFEAAHFVVPELAAASLLDLNATVKKNVYALSSAGAPTSVTERSLIVMGEDGPGDAPVVVPEQVHEFPAHPMPWQKYPTYSDAIIPLMPPLMSPPLVDRQEIVPVALLFVARQSRAALAGLLSADLFWSLLLSVRTYTAAPNAAAHKGAGGALEEAMVADMTARVLAHLADYVGRHKLQVLASKRLSRIAWGQLSPLLDGTALFSAAELAILQCGTAPAHPAHAPSLARRLKGCYSQEGLRDCDCTRGGRGGAC
jgi:hypothetical protein